MVSLPLPSRLSPEYAVTGHPVDAHKKLEMSCGTRSPSKFHSFNRHRRCGDFRQSRGHAMLPATPWRANLAGPAYAARRTHPRGRYAARTTSLLTLTLTTVAIPGHATYRRTGAQVEAGTPATDGAATTHGTSLPGMTSPPITNKPQQYRPRHRSRHTPPAPIWAATYEFISSQSSGNVKAGARRSPHPHSG